MPAPDTYSRIFAATENKPIPFLGADIGNMLIAKRFDQDSGWVCQVRAQMRSTFLDFAALGDAIQPVDPTSHEP